MTNTYEELYHHGIKGQKWGVRRYRNEDGSLTAAGKRHVQNEKYTAEQRKRDRSVYSRGAEKRINRKMNEGVSISAARSSEADRIGTYRNTARTSRKIGRYAGAVVGAFAGIPVSKAVQKWGMSSRNPMIREFVSNKMFDLLGPIGIGTVLSRIGGDAGADIGSGSAMLAGGYNPKKMRD